jgi:hypothetical protein
MKFQIHITVTDEHGVPQGAYIEAEEADVSAAVASGVEKIKRRIASAPILRNLEEQIEEARQRATSKFAERIPVAIKAEEEVAITQMARGSAERLAATEALKGRRVELARIDSEAKEIEQEIATLQEERSALAKSIV